MLLPKVKLKTLPTFPAVINGGVGIDVAKANGSLTVDLDYSEFGVISSIPTSPTSYILTYDTVTASYVMVPSHLLGGGVAGIADAPIDGTLYGRQSAMWVQVPSAPSAADPTASIGLTAINGTAATVMRSDAAPAISQSITPTWTGKHTFSGGVTLNRPSSADGLTINNTLNGAAHYGFVETMSATGNISPNGWNYNLINITSDNAQHGSTGFGVGLGIQTTFGGAAMTGGRLAFQAAMTMTAASSPANGNRNYVAGEFIANSTTPDNGTNTGAGAQGALFAINPVAVLSAGATNWLEVSGGEVNIGMDPTASAKYMLGWTIIGGYNGLTGTAASMGAGVSVSSNTGATFDAGYIVSDLNAAWPIKASGSLQRAYITGSTPTVANGTDWSGVTFSGAAFKSQGFQVTGNGSVNAALSSFVANAGATGFPITTIQNAHNTAGDWALKIGAGATGSDSSTWLVLFEDGAMTGGVGTIARSTTGVVYNTASDRRLKENFREPSVGLDELMRIKAQNFNFINAPENDVNGFVAQDLYEIYPWAVTKGDDDDIKKPWQIDYGRLSPLIVNAMQQLIGKVDDLTARIAVLEKRLGEVT